jgi:hypothetical protein|nr:MAG TPA: hypothetical protein [Caudoviricetes sp.]
MIYDESGKPIENPDLTLGYVTEQVVIRDDAEPIDDIEKFAWDDDDYETRQVYIPYTADELARMAEAGERAEREQWLASAPSQLADMDELLVALYESQLETDEAIVALYEGGI